MKTQFVRRILAGLCCVLGFVILMSQFPVFATSYSYCSQGANWGGAWSTGGTTCRVKAGQQYWRGCTDSATCYHQRTVVNSPDRCYNNSTTKCQTCEWDNPATERFYDQEQYGTCHQGDVVDPDSPDWPNPPCYCIYQVGLQDWQDISHTPEFTSQPIKRCHTLNPCL